MHSPFGQHRSGFAVILRLFFIKFSSGGFSVKRIFGAVVVIFLFFSSGAFCSEKQKLSFKEQKESDTELTGSFMAAYGFIPSFIKEDIKSNSWAESGVNGGVWLLSLCCMNQLSPTDGKKEQSFALLSVGEMLAANNIGNAAMLMYREGMANPENVLKLKISAMLDVKNVAIACLTKSVSNRFFGRKSNKNKAFFATVFAASMIYLTNYMIRYIFSDYIPIFV